MMLLAEEIIQAVQLVLQTGVDAEVFRGRVDPLEQSQLPAVGIFQGADSPAEEQIWPLFDELLEVRTEVGAKSKQENIETDLNELRRQVHKILLMENALSLAYIIDIIPNGADEPKTNGSSEQYTGTMVINWIVHYRHQYADAGAGP
jgi:hypothetical protein